MRFDAGLRIVPSKGDCLMKKKARRRRIVAARRSRRSSPAAASSGAEEKAAEVTSPGTVVDLHCYVTHGIHDAEHTACSNACIARGVPAGFLAEDGTLYVLFGEKPFSVKDRVAGLADVPVN